jgi:hypothetical protein
MYSHIIGEITMKQFNFSTKRSVIVSICIVLLTLAFAGTVAAADQQAAGPGSFGNRTAPGLHFQNGTASGYAGGPGNMMQQSGTGRGMPGVMTGIRGGAGIMQGASPGMRGSAGAMQGAGILQKICMAIGILLTGLLLIVWLIVGILLSVLLYRKVRQDKTS